MRIQWLEKTHCFNLLLVLTLILVLSGGGCQPSFTGTQTATISVATTPAYTLLSPTTQPVVVTPVPTATGTNTPTHVEFPEVPYELISQDSLFAYLQDLTSIQPYSGWRNSASSGEAEGLDYVEKKMREFTTLQDWGMEFERQTFRVFMSTDFWETRLFLTVAGREIEVPAEGMRGSRWSPLLARTMDSDGVLNDSERNPMVASSSILLIHDEKTLNTLKAEQVKEHILVMDFALIDTFVESDALDNGSWLMQLLDQGALGLVLVSQSSTMPGESHGTLAGEGSIFQTQVPNVHIPILHVRLVDLAPAGIASLDDFNKVESARLIWDTDVFSPGRSGNLVVRIPGLDSSRAVIVGAHIDSPNNPGAFDDGSGSVALLEVARVINESRVQPAVDLYLAWFGGHEIGTYGSAHFISTHQELMDRTLAMLQMDCLGHPQDGKIASISVGSTSYGRFGDDRLPWSDFLSTLAAIQGISLDKEVEYGPIADNSNFDAFNVPNVNLIYFDFNEYRIKGNSYIHFSMHWHDPYDTVILVSIFARKCATVFRQKCATNFQPDAPPSRVASF